jgi:large subunit ribosomal protein L4
MAKQPIYNLKSEKVGEVEISAALAELPHNSALLHEAVVHHLACKRAGTHATKTRGDVSGGGKKPWKQKGTGRARHGSTRSPIWRHGGTTHGPQPKDYSYQFPKKKKNLALRTAFSGKMRDFKLLVLDNFHLSAAKTKEVAAVSKRFGWKNALVVDAGNAVLGRAASNFKAIKAIRPEELNVYDVLKYDRLVVTVSGLKKIEEVFAS